MKFEYEIGLEESVAADMLYFNLRMRSKQLKQALFWVAAGALFIVVAWRQQVPGWAPTLLAVTGGWWIYASVWSLFPAWQFRNSYRSAGLSGEKYRADLDEEGFEVTGRLCSWHVRWAGVSVKTEDKRVFLLYGANTLFIFGKKYLTDEQQSELRRLAGLPAFKTANMANSAS